MLRDAYDAVLEMAKTPGTLFALAKVDNYERCRPSKQTLVVPVYGVTQFDSAALHTLLEESLGTGAKARMSMGDAPHHPGDVRVPCMEISVPLARFRPYNPFLAAHVQAPPTLLDRLVSWRYLFYYFMALSFLSLAIYVHSELDSNQRSQLLYRIWCFVWRC